MTWLARLPIKARITAAFAAAMALLLLGIGLLVYWSMRSSAGFARVPLLSARQLRDVRGPTFFERQVPGVQDTARLLAVPVRGPATPRVLVVGTTMADRSDALRHLAAVFAVAGPVGVLATSLVAGSLPVSESGRSSGCAGRRQRSLPPGWITASICRTRRTSCAASRSR